MHWLWLILAIALEVLGTTALKYSHGFTRLWPTLLSLAAYGIAFAFLARALLVLPVGVAYAVWSGVGTALVAIIGFAVFGQRLDAVALFGIGLIVTGVMVLNLWSSSG